jgi:hypothetical protein
VNAKQRRKLERRIILKFRPMADAIDSLAAGVEEGIVSTQELRDIARELRTTGRDKRPSAKEECGCCKKSP